MGDRRQNFGQNHHQGNFRHGGHPGGNFRGGGGGGGYHRGQQMYGYGEPQFQRSFVGKRGRDDGGDTRPRLGPEGVLITKLLHLCDKIPGTTQADWSVERFLEDMLRTCRKDIEHGGDLVLRLVVESAVQLSTKTQHYALLVGLLNVEQHEFVNKLVTSVVADFSTSLSTDRDRARLLLRFLAAMAVAGVLQPASLLGLLQSLVDASLTIAKASVDSSGASWQPYTDYLVYIVLATMPWCATDLQSSNPDLLATLLTSVNSYMESRPRATDPELHPMYGSRSEEDLAARSDSGGASFLTHLWSSVQELQAAEWRLEAVQALHEPFKEKLTGELQEVPTFSIPTAPPGVPTSASVPEAAALVRAAFPPRGGIRLLGKEHLEGTKLAMERFVAEEYILDTLTYFESDRSSCVLRLATALPAVLSSALEKDKVRNLIAEVLFGQLLTLPTPKLSTAAYSTILIDLCKMRDFGFARALSSCVRELFASVPHMDPDLRSRLVAWLAYHLSNFEFQWPWDRWAWVVDEAPHHPQRQFCEELVHRLLRLSYHERVAKVLPEAFQQLLGPAPTVPLLPTPEALAAAAAARSMPGAADVDMGDAAAAPASGAEVQPADDTSAQAAKDAVPEPPDEEIMTAVDFLVQVRAKLSNEELQQWLEQQQVQQKLGSHEAVLRVVMRALLTLGAKTPSHLGAAFERHAGLLRSLLTTASTTSATEAEVPSGREGPSRGPGALLLLQQVADFYAQQPQKVLMAVDWLLALGLVSPVVVMEWALEGEDVSNLDDVRRSSAVWEVLHYVVSRTLGRQPELQEARTRAAEDLAIAHKEHAASVDADGSGTCDNLESHTSKQVSAAQQALDAAEAAMEPAQLEGQQVLLQAYKSFAAFLASESVSGSWPDDPLSDTWQELQYAHLRSFTRRYAGHIAPLLPQLQEGVLADTTMPEKAKQIVLQALSVPEEGDAAGNGMAVDQIDAEAAAQDV